MEKLPINSDFEFVGNNGEKPVEEWFYRCYLSVFVPFFTMDLNYGRNTLRLLAWIYLEITSLSYFTVASGLMVMLKGLTLLLLTSIFNNFSSNVSEFRTSRVPLLRMIPFSSEKWYLNPLVSVLWVKWLE